MQPSWAAAESVGPATSPSTNYHDDLDSLSPEHWDEDYLYREIKGAANEMVDRFLLEHRGG